LSRRSRYADDARFRHSQKARSRLQHRREKEQFEQLAAITLSTQRYMTIAVQDRRDSRYGEEISVPAYGPEDLAQVLGVTTQTVHNWIERRILPANLYMGTDSRRVRLFTYDQVHAVWKCSPHLAEVIGKDADGRANGKFARELRAIWESMPDGVWPSYATGSVASDCLHTVDTACYIYGLVDPCSRRIRYVGSSLNPDERFEQHRSQKASRNIRNWWRKLGREGCSPYLIILERTSEERRYEREDGWIQFLRESGSDLLNDYPRHPAPVPRDG
jgi:DNA-binding transcriptional regulator YiaG